MYLYIWREYRHIYMDRADADADADRNANADADGPSSPKKIVGKSISAPN